MENILHHFLINPPVVIPEEPAPRERILRRRERDFRRERAHRRNVRMYGNRPRAVSDLSSEDEEDDEVEFVMEVLAPAGAEDPNAVVFLGVVPAAEPAPAEQNN